MSRERKLHVFLTLESAIDLNIYVKEHKHFVTHIGTKCKMSNKRDNNIS